MTKKYFSILLLSALLTTLHADCTQMPTGNELSKSIASKDLERSKALLSVYNADVKTFLSTCKEEGAVQEVTLMQLTFQDNVQALEEKLKKAKQPAYDCNNVPDDTTLNKAFGSKDAEAIKKAYNTYKQSAEGYLEHCASHEEFDFVYEASLLHEEEYANWEQHTK